MKPSKPQRNRKQITHPPMPTTNTSTTVSRGLNSLKLVSETSVRANILQDPEAVVVQPRAQFKGLTIFNYFSREDLRNLQKYINSKIK